MKLNKRELMGLGAGAFAFAAFGGSLRPAFAALSPETEEAIKAFTGGAEMKSGGLAQHA